MLSRIFKSGNSLALRIPKELAFAEGALDVEIERRGETPLIRPVSKATLGGVGKAFAAFPRGFMVDGRELRDQKKRACGAGR